MTAPKTRAIASLYLQTQDEELPAAQVHRQMLKQQAAARRRESGRHVDLLKGLTEDVVYFVAIGHLIKIGHSRRLKQRLVALNATTDDLLAIELGGHEREQELHRTFHSAWVRNEMFARTPELLAYIESKRPA